MGMATPQSCRDLELSATGPRGSVGQREKRGQLKSQVVSTLLRANRTDDGIAGSCVCF